MKRASMCIMERVRGSVESRQGMGLPYINKGTTLIKVT